MEAPTRARILCVDDEPQVLEGLSLHLGRRYDLVTATGGQAALELLTVDKTPAVVVSDMRMPGMDGAAFLAKARALAPDAVRILLTGQADIHAAIAAVNEGQVFRFLTKPCPPQIFLAAIDEAIRHHHLLTDERVLLEQTLHGSIKTLTDVLALTHPASFGRATRIKALVTDMAAALGMGVRWPVEVAAMLSQLGCITLPDEVVEKVHYGQALSEGEQRMVERMPELTERLLANIPRLEVVRGILSTYAKVHKRLDPALREEDKKLVIQGAAILAVASDFDDLEAQGNSASLAVDTIACRRDRYHPEVVQALGRVRAVQGKHEDVRELPLSGLRVGMRLLDDVKMSTGTLLAARGCEVTESFVERARNFRPGSVKEPVRVLVPSAPRSAR
jgi:response regulator RpfG family c-di-GMP phosphodiesterase